MSVGDMSEILDKKGRPAKVFDVIVNPKIAERLRPVPNKTGSDAEALLIFVEVLFNYAVQKFKMYLIPNFDCLEKCKYKGTYVKFQRVKGSKKPKINVIDSSSSSIKTENDPKVSNSVYKQGSKGVIKPEWKLYVVFENGESEEFDGFNFDSEVTGFKVEVALPLLTTGSLIS
jgi:hypothetical protein